MTFRIPRGSGPAGQCGFTSIELLVGVAIAGVLSAIAYPSFAAQVLAARRGDALVAAATAQMAQERWHGNEGRYGTLTELGLAGTSSAGHYVLRMEASGSTGYRLDVVARGAQTGDANCRHLRIVVERANTSHHSGGDANVLNDATVNRRCWRR